MTISSLGATNSFSSLRCRYLQWGLSQHYYSKSNHHSTGKIYYFGEDVIRYKPQIIRKSQKLLKSAKLILMKKFTIFLVKSKLSTTKQCKTTTFSRFFSHEKNSQFFSSNQSCKQLNRAKPLRFHDFFSNLVATFSVAITLLPKQTLLSPKLRHFGVFCKFLGKKA